MTKHLRRLEFLGFVGLVSTGAADASADRAPAFRQSLSESRYVEGQNVTVEYHWFTCGAAAVAAAAAPVVRTVRRLESIIAFLPYCCRGHVLSPGGPSLD